MLSRFLKRALPLDWSIWSENELRSYLHQGSDPNRKDGDGGTPLIQAISLGALSLVKELLDKGADANATTNNGLPLLCTP